MARSKKPATKSAGSVRLSHDQYRSLILDKLRHDIDAKRAAYEKVLTATPADLGSMAYYKMKYWQMKYWKKGADIIDVNIAVNPAMPVAKVAANAAKKSIR
jgi:hypothetical protein